MEREEKIRLIAYKIWEEEGCIHGQDCEHWARAEFIWESQKQQSPARDTRATAKKAGKSKVKRKKINPK